MNNIIFFDLEVNRNSRKIQDIGAVFNDQEFHEPSLVNFGKFLKQSDLICGHNIINHDLPVLRKSGIAHSLSDKLFIDTLYLSALLFAEKPYHHLVKDYKIFRGQSESNDPLIDSKLCRELLLDEVAKFNSLPEELKSIYFALLEGEPAFKGFFSIVNGEKKADPAALIRKFFDAKVCTNCNFEPMLSDPVAFAFALALVNTENSESILPAWMVKTFPQVSDYLHRLGFTPCEEPNCRYCRKKLDPEKALYNYFGYREFRKFSEEETIPLQERVVKAALDHQSLVAVFPTGGGKSLTFQLPALIDGQATRSLTVVISPLQSLMKDQIDVLLQRHGITQAVAINGSLSPLERMEAIERIEDGRAHLLYISPESLRSKTIHSLLVKRAVSRFVIDEAHCFSSWGHDFRVDYLYIAEFIKKLQEEKGQSQSIPVSCFTATAKPGVIEDIKNYFYERLGLKLETYLAKTDRKNLHYGVYVAEDDVQKYQQLLQLLSQTTSPVIIYVSRTRSVDELADKIRNEGLKALPYHGKMKREERITNQNRFMQGEVDIIVATSAFGMGVDKENVGMVIHYDLSESLENYLQESGRAGRKPEIDANCFILFDKNDLNKHFSLFYNSRLNLKEIDQVWRGIKQLSRYRDRISRSALEIAKAAGWDTELYELETRIKTSVAVLEESGYVKRGLDAPRVFADSFLVRDYNQAIEKVRNDPELSETEKTSITRILQRVIKEEETRTDYLSDVLGMERDEIERLIRVLKEKKILGDAKDLSAFVDVSNSPKNAKKTAWLYISIEKELLNLLKFERQDFYIKEINENLIESGIPDASMDKVLDILRYWELTGLISKERTDRSVNAYRIKFRKDKSSFQELIEQRHETSVIVLEYLISEKNRQLLSNKASESEQPVDFSILDLKKETERAQGFFRKTIDNTSIEKSLLFLNAINAIQLDKGFIILYRPMVIDRIETDNKKRFTKEDYRKLADFYQAKIEQIHIIGEYASKMIKDLRGAMTFADEYFKLPYEQFVDKYFKERKEQIRRPLTPDKFNKVFGELSPEQLAIVKDSEHNTILVSAGPGSGKTRVLVHKIASVLMMEDVKPEQFLMLTFSKAASLEFKQRLNKLVGGISNYIDIFTYHSYCFDLQGRIGSLEKSSEIIKNTLDAIKNKSIPLEKIAKKSMLVIDEFQDVNQEEFSLITTIMEQAENIRVIVVGDDDQNIYEFRGADVKYMREFRQKYRAKQYELLRNYRSRKNLVEFSNLFVRKIGNRMKSNNLDAFEKENGRIRIIQYNSPSIITPLINDLCVNEYEGTTAVLTKTNEEAGIVNSLLKQAGKKSKLVLTNEGFSIRDLLEIRFFTTEVLKHASENLGLIADEDWNRGKALVDRQFEYSKNLSLCLDIIKAFEKTNKKKMRTEWYSFISEMQIENFIYPEKQTILVSTMHKAKGREFENVILLLENFSAISDADYRLLYVAITRAKSNVTIHTNTGLFSEYKKLIREYSIDEQVYTTPSELTFHLTHKDIVLNSFKLDAVAHTVSEMLPGQKLIMNEENNCLLTESNRFVIKFSKKFQEKLDKLIRAGYRFKEAKADHILYWKDKEDGKERRVVLGEVRLKRNLETD